MGRDFLCDLCRVDSGNPWRVSNRGATCSESQGAWMTGYTSELGPTVDLTVAHLFLKFYWEGSGNGQGKAIPSQCTAYCMAPLLG